MESDYWTPFRSEKSIRKTIGIPCFLFLEIQTWCWRIVSTLFASPIYFSNHSAPEFEQDQLREFQSFYMCLCCKLTCSYIEHGQDMSRQRVPSKEGCVRSVWGLDLLPAFGRFFVSYVPVFSMFSEYSSYPGLGVFYLCSFCSACLFRHGSIFLQTRVWKWLLLWRDVKLETMVGSCNNPTITWPAEIGFGIQFYLVSMCTLT
jgi:hypothetical protein